MNYYCNICALVHFPDEVLASGWHEPVALKGKDV